MIHAEDYHSPDEMCACVREFIREMKSSKTNSSFFSPYLRYIQDQVPLVPCLWSEDAKDIFEKVIGEHLPPQNYISHIDWWLGTCGGDMDDIIMVLQLISRSAGTADSQKISILPPVFDLYNHRNGPWENTKTYASADQPLEVRATRDISRGEQIYNSYGKSTSEILKNYGFTEADPQTWILDVEEVGVVEFEINADDAVENGPDEFQWVIDPSHDYNAVSDFLRIEVSRLNEVGKEFLSDHALEKFNVTLDEIFMIRRYYTLLITSLKHAALNLYNNKDEL